MKSVAVIVEYNPFHNGHLYQLETMRKQFPTAVIIVILNGDFLQRGEPALLNKWTRTEWALKGGADLVVELPFVFGTQRADIFAEGGIRIAQMLGVSTLCFGIEEPLPETIALEELSPNQRLGFFYKEKINEFAPQMHVFEMKRVHAAYNEQVPTHNSITSATAIRRMIQTNNPRIKNFIPSFVYNDLQNQQAEFAAVEDYYPYIQTNALLHPIAFIPALLTNGGYKTIQKGLIQTNSYKDFFEFIHHKHHSRTHTQRSLTFLFTQTTHEMLDEARQDVWSRILGYNETGQRYVSYLKHTTPDTLNFIQKPQRLQAPHYMLQYNSTVASNLLRTQSLSAALRREFDQRPIKHTNKE